MFHRLWQSEILFSKAQKMHRQNHLTEAIALYRRVIDLNPKTVGARLHLAIALSDQGAYPEAVESITRAIELKPQYPVLYMFLGLIHYDRGSDDEAVQAFEKAAELDSGYQIAVCLKQLTHFKLGRFEEAFAYFHHHYNWGLDFESRLLFASELYLKQHPGDAVSFFQTELSATGAAAPRYHRKIRRALLSLKFGFLRTLAQLVYIPAASRETRLAFLQGQKCYALGDFDAAIAAFQGVLAEGSSHLRDQALQQLVDVYLGIGDLENFLQYIRQIEAYQGTLDFLDHPAARPSSSAQYPALHSELVLVMGIVHYERGDIPPALDALALVSTLDPKNYLSYYYRGMCHLVYALPEPAGSLAQDNYRAACFWFKKALDTVNPGIVSQRVAEAMRVFRLTNNQ